LISIALGTSTHRFATMPIASMEEMRKQQEEEAKKAKGAGKGVESYSGGSSSGMAVMSGPVSDEDWAKMAQHSDTGPADGAYNITLWRNGFTINDGPLRPLTDPLNKKFVDEIARGQCPSELQKSPDDDVQVSVHDKRAEDYTPPAPAGGMTRKGPSAPAKIENAVASGGDGTVNVDASKPTTKIQIRFHDGSKKAQEFNQDHTVGDLRNFCAQITGQPMSIKGGFPPKPITDDSQTLKDAGLCGAAVTVAPQ